MSEGRGNRKWASRTGIGEQNRENGKHIGELVEKMYFINLLIKAGTKFKVNPHS